MVDHCIRHIQAAIAPESGAKAQIDIIAVHKQALIQATQLLNYLSSVDAGRAGGAKDFARLLKLGAVGLAVAEHYAPKEGVEAIAGRINPPRSIS
jgi:hypothetical protein